MQDPRSITRTLLLSLASILSAGASSVACESGGAKVETAAAPAVAAEAAPAAAAEPVKSQGTGRS